jgi:hypothetical protein
VPNRCRHRVFPAAAMVVALSFGLVDAVTAQVVVVIEDGRKARADITLPRPGGGTYTADLELEFDNPQNLTVPCLGISADVLDAAEIADVESRLPDPSNQEIDPAFPVRVTVDPPPGCGLQFDNDVDIDLETDELVHVPFSPYRLMKGPIGGSFLNITGLVDPGSVRARGSGGSFSEIVIVREIVQDYADDADAAFAALQARLNDPAIGLTARQTLETDLAVSIAAYQANNFAQAIGSLEDLDSHCGALGGPALPNSWRAQGDLVNAEGEVVSYSDHLKFLLGRLDGSP